MSEQSSLKRWLHVTLIFLSTIVIPILISSSPRFHPGNFHSPDHHTPRQSLSFRLLRPHRHYVSSNRLHVVFSLIKGTQVFLICGLIKFLFLQLIFFLFFNHLLIFVISFLVGSFPISLIFFIIFASPSSTGMICFFSIVWGTDCFFSSSAEVANSVSKSASASYWCLPLSPVDSSFWKTPPSLNFSTSASRSIDASDADRLTATGSLATRSTM